MTEPPSPPPGSAGETDATAPHDRAARRRQRRIGLIGLAVGMLAAAGLGLLTDDGGDGNATTVEPWNAIVATHPGSGEITLHDANGDEIETFDTGFDTAALRGARGRFVLVTDADDSHEAAIIDTTSGETTWRGEPASDDSVLGWSPWVTGAPIVVDGSRSGGEMVVIDAESGNEIDIAEAAELDEPRMTPQQIWPIPGTSRYAVGDSERTVIVGFDSDSGVIDGALVAFDDERLLIAQVDGGALRLVFAPLDDLSDPDPSAHVSQLRGVQLVGDEAIVLTVDGGLLRASPGEAEPSLVATVDVGGEVDGAWRSPHADRFVVDIDTDGDGKEDGDRYETLIIDLEGDEIARVEGRSLSGGVGAATRCAIVRPDDTIRVIDIETGEEVGSAPAGGEATPLTSADQCTMAVVDGGADATHVVSHSGEIELDGRATQVAPDGTSVVVRDEETSVSIHDPRAPGGDPVVIDAAQIAFVTR